MIIPIQDPKRQYDILRKELDAAVQNVLKSGRWLFGKQCASFEEEFASFCNVSHAITVANGTDALEIALIAAGARGREVITVANAGGYTTTVCRVIGATPVYTDIDPDSQLMSIQAALEAVTPKTAAVVITHLYGRLADVQAIRSGLSNIGRTDVVIIEDCAQAHGAQRDGFRAGSQGDIGTFSFYPTKNLGAMGDGGAIVCNDDSYAQRIKELRQYGWDRRYHSVVPFGRNSRMDEIQAAILRVKLPFIDEWNHRRRQIIGRYRAAASGPLTVWFDPSEAFAGHLAIARHPERDLVRKKLSESGVSSDIHYPVLDFEQQSQEGLPMVVHDQAHAKQSAREILSLPCFPEMTDNEISHVCESLQKVGR